MSATTSLKLTAELKGRASEAAQRLGVSPHAFMVDAIERATRAAEQHARFVATAETARREMLDSDVGLPAAQVHAYLRAKTAPGAATPAKSPKPPKARAWRK